VIKLRNLRWYIAALLFTATVINYIDRTVIGVTKPFMMSDLHMDQVQYSHVVQCFLIAYSVMYLLSGFAVDRWGTRKALAAFAGWWSSANILHYFVRGAASLEIFQTLLGIGEPGSFNAAVRSVSEWFPPRERAKVNGIINSGASIGAIVGTAMVSLLLLHHSWRYAFVVTGVLGFAWIGPWLLFYRLPQQHSFITDPELDYIRSGPGILCPEGKPTFQQLLRKPDIWGLMLARFFSDPVWWFMVFWLPGYLHDQRGFDLHQLAYFAWLPYLASDIGGIFGGWWSDRIIHTAGSTVRARMWPMGICAAMMPVSILVPVMRSATAAIILLCVIAFAHMSWKTNLMTITNDLYPAECIGTIFGLLMVGSGIGGFLFQGIIGYLVQYFSYRGVFLLMGFMHPIAFVVTWLFLRRANLLRQIE
jgi:ACS family hexuronate transporter-like MFS transporter